MSNARRCVVLIALVGACSDSVSSPQARSAGAIPNGTAPVAAAIWLGAMPMAVDETGVPRLLGGRDVAPVKAATATEAAKLYLAKLAPAWGVHPDQMPELRANGEVKVAGGTIARIEQRIDGMPVARRELRIMVRGSGELIAASGMLVDANVPRTPAIFADNEAGAVARAVAQNYGSDDVIVEQSTARKAWYPVKDGLEAAWIVEMFTSKPGSTQGEAWRTVLAANDRRVLANMSLVDDAAVNYRVFAEPNAAKVPLDGPVVDPTPHPTGAPTGVFPSYVASTMISVDSLNALGDPWLTATATQTQGNNVDAYVDLNSPNGFSMGDFRADMTSAGTFDRVYDLGVEPLANQTQQKASITSLFYIINWLHDFWYDAGFVETAGNAQASNYGRGGMENDALRAEAQDNALGGSRNNANMSTPSDGSAPRMQVYLWSGKGERSLSVSGRTPTTNVAVFGPKSFDLTAQVVIANDGVMTATDACTALPSCTGKIVLVDRGNCTFKTKALNVQNAGGVGMLLANNTTSTNPPTLTDDANITTTITIASMSITMAEGATLTAEINAGTVTATMHRLTSVEVDGGLDGSVIAHEFGHYLHHRLSDCNTKMCGAMSEGWGDFTALMMVSRAGDNFNAVYPLAVYATQGIVGDAAYFGIRRVPYSTNMDVNSLSFRHMTDGVPTPTTHPFLSFGQNSEVHNAGEIWAETLWQAYAELQLAGTSFDTVRSNMAKYVVAGLLMSPVDATPTEMRDAILTAVGASSQTDHDIVLNAFAKRGMGSCAISAPRDSSDFVGIVESTELGGRLEPGVAVLADGSHDCDSDGVLDAGETATLTIPLANRGNAVLNNVTATITTSTPGLTIVSQPDVIDTLQPGLVRIVTVDVQLASDAKGPLAGSIDIKLDTADGCAPRTVTIPVALGLDTDEVTGASATDTFDAKTSIWTGSTTAWQHTRESALDGIWHGDDVGMQGLTDLVSPPLTASATAPLVVTFSHRYSFEYSQATAWDGGVIEYTVDGGMTWADVAMLTSPGYGEVLTGQSSNPLAGRNAYVDTNAAYPGFENVTLDFGTQLAGQTFQLRFRIATDQAVSGPGWDLDDVAFTGIEGTPFPNQVVDGTACAGPDGSGSGSDEDVTAGGGGCCDAGAPAPASMAGAFVVGLLVLRRRRRR